MFKRILKINELNNILRNGLVCAYEEEKKEDGSFEISFQYLTSNEEFIDKYFIDDENIEDEDVEFNARGLFNLLENSVIKNKAFQAFSGEVVHIGSLTPIQYKKYLNDFNRDSFLLDFSKDLYSLENFERVYIESINEEAEDEFIFETYFKDYDSEAMFINKKGENKYGQLVVSNFSQKDLENLFEEDEGYLFLGDKSGPKYISKKILGKLGNLNDLGFLGISEDEVYSLLPVIKITYDDTVIDMIILNNDIKNNFIDDDNKENIEFDSFQKDTNIYFDNKDLDIIEDIDDEIDLDLEDDD